jgi:putative NADH-flavin reductase
MEIIAREMKKAAVPRIIAVGGMGVLDNKEGKLLLHQAGYPAQYLAVGEEHLKAFNTLKESALDWTFVCCPDILPGDAAGQYQIMTNMMPEPNSYRIQAADLASFMLEELEKGNFIRKRIGICN